MGPRQLRRRDCRRCRYCGGPCNTREQRELGACRGHRDLPLLEHELERLDELELDAALRALVLR